MRLKYTSAMIVGLTLFGLAFSCCSTRTRRTTAVSNSTNPYVGLWKYPEHAVWIKILPDGRAFQCRISQSGRAIRSEGVLQPEGRIQWQEIWGTDIITRTTTGITVVGKYEISSLVPSSSVMDSECHAPF
jgi:hypothetical protein